MVNAPGELNESDNLNTIVNFSPRCTENTCVVYAYGENESRKFVFGYADRSVTYFSSITSPDGVPCCFKPLSGNRFVSDRGTRDDGTNYDLGVFQVSEQGIQLITAVRTGDVAYQRFF